MSSNKKDENNNCDVYDFNDDIIINSKISNQNIKIEQKNLKIEDLLNNNKIDTNELPPVNIYNKDYGIGRTQTKYINKLKKQVNDLNTELNKMRNDKDVENYKKLENNYMKKSKEMSQLKQDNNILLFQIEDLNRKYKDKNNNINSNSLKKKLNKLKETKQNNLVKIYNTNPNIALSTRSHFFEGIEMNNKNNELISKLKSEIELYKNVDEENKKLKNQIEEKDVFVNKFKNKIQNLEIENKNLRNENNATKDKYSRLFSEYSKLERINTEREKKQNSLKKQMRSNKNLLEKKKLDEFKEEINSIFLLIFSTPSKKCDLVEFFVLLIILKLFTL